MIATTLIRRSAPRLAKDFLARQGGVFGTHAFHLSASTPMVYHRAFSTIDPSATVAEPPTITKKVRVLNIEVVKSILQELNMVDTNKDGR